jgi:hydrogenase-4 component B
VFKSDLLSSFFVLVISLITAIISIYAIGYLEPYQNKGKKLSSHCFFLPILTATMLLVVTCQNALMFLILWELMSLSSFFLVIFEDDKKEVISAGIKYLIYMHISVVFIIAAFIVMSNYSGDYDFNSFKYIFMHYPYLKNIVFLLAFIGFGTKAGFFQCTIGYLTHIQQPQVTYQLLCLQL